MDQLPEKQIITSVIQNNWTINASFCASAEQTVVFQDKRSRTAFCSTFFRKKVEEEKIYLNLSLILNVLASAET
jgi:hypothetical protein